MALEEKGLFQVAFKVFLRGGNNLLLIHDIHGDWDLPGGRMLNNEFHAPSSLVIKRKIKEEVGSMIKYKLGEQKVLFKVERTDERPKPHKVRIVGIGFDAEYLGGPVDKGEYIDDYKWVDVTSLKPEDYFTGGWLKGVQDYLAMQRKG